MARFKNPETIHVADGVEAVFSLDFPFLRREDVFVQVDKILVTDYTWVDDTNIQLAVVPKKDQEVRIFRDTPAQVPDTQFSQGIPFLPRYIDANNKQLLYAVQLSSARASRSCRDTSTRTTSSSCTLCRKASTPRTSPSTAYSTQSVSPRKPVAWRRRHSTPPMRRCAVPWASPRFVP
ncbi:non-contractile tail fiber protein [Pseudomonas phage vB_Pae_S1]|nr:non-contractile tail fiber protein [Pseudomonas phage vB_Pae_S1]